MATSLISPDRTGQQAGSHDSLGEKSIREKKRSSIDLWAGSALFLGLIIVVTHGGWNASINATALLWAGANLALGALLGFLFGVPHSPSTINIGQAGVVAGSAPMDAVSISEHAPPVGQPPAPPTGQPSDLPAGKPPIGTGIDEHLATPRLIPSSGSDHAQKNNAAASANSSESNLEQVSDWVAKLLLGAGLTQVEKLPALFTSWGYHVALGLGKPADAASNQIFATALILYFLVLGFIAGYLVTKVELSKSLSDRPV